MKLLMIYALFVTAGEAAAVGLGEIVELTFPSASLFVFLGLSFAVVWLGWQLALRVTSD